MDEPEMGPVTATCGHINWYATAEDAYIAGNYEVAQVAALMEIGGVLGALADALMNGPHG